MTAYLQPGDAVHLAVPITPTHSKEAANAEGRATVGELTAVCNRFGVTVASWSGHSQLGHPVVVAVFRAGPKPEEQP